MYDQITENERTSQNARNAAISEFEKLIIKVILWRMFRNLQLTSDVSHCVRVTLILSMVVLSKCRKLEISLKSIKDVLQNNGCAELTSDRRTSLDHSWTHQTSLAEFGSSPFQNGGNENNFTQIQRLFSDKKIDNN